MFMPLRMSSRRWLEISLNTSWAGADGGKSRSAAPANSSFLYCNINLSPLVISQELVEGRHLVVETLDELPKHGVGDPSLGIQLVLDDRVFAVVDAVEDRPAELGVDVPLID